MRRAGPGGEALSRLPRVPQGRARQPPRPASDRARRAPATRSGIGQVQALVTDLALLPMEGRVRVAIIEAAHRLNPDAQNALLKTLEEPVGEACIVLCADDPVANARGYRTVIVIPETQSQEKKDMLRLCGADLRQVAAVPYKDPNNYVHVSERMAKELAMTHREGAIWANQFDNTANRAGHFQTTGPEIWQQTDGKVDGFVSAVGTGGTLAGVGMYLKEQNPKVRIGLADPMGAALSSYYTKGELKSEGSSITEGIGQGRITKNLEGAPVDAAYQIPDEEALPIIFQLLKQEGLCLGGSTGINVAGAIRMAKDLGPGHTIVTLLCDSGTRYQTKLFNPAFLKSKNLARPGLARRMNDVIAMKGGGYYSLATLGAKHVIDGATPLVLEAIAAMPESPRGLRLRRYGDRRWRHLPRPRRAGGRGGAPALAGARDRFGLYRPAAQRLQCPDRQHPWPGTGRRRLSPVLRDLLPSPDPAQRQPRPRLLRHRHALAQRQALRHLRPCPGGGRLGSRARRLRPPG